MDAQVDTALLDVDGSCRDINFDRATWPGVRSLIDQSREEFENVRVGCTSHDSDEEQIADVNAALSLVERSGGYCQILFDGGSNVLRHLQVFASSAPGESLFVELTFFPQDVLPRPSPQGPFVAWVDAASNILGATRYFVRYENASWKFGDLSPHAGVFLVRAPRLKAPDPAH